MQESGESRVVTKGYLQYLKRKRGWDGIHGGRSQ